MIISLLDLPQFLACLRVQSNSIGVQLIQENLAVRVCQAAIDGVAAGNRHHLRILLRDVLPLHGRAFFREVEGVDDIRKWRMDEHRVSDHQGAAFVASKDAGGKCPRDAEILDVSGIDRIQRAIPGRRVILVWHVPLFVFFFWRGCIALCCRLRIARASHSEHRQNERCPHEQRG